MKGFPPNMTDEHRAAIWQKRRKRGGNWGREGDEGRQKYLLTLNVEKIQIESMESLRKSTEYKNRPGIYTCTITAETADITSRLTAGTAVELHLCAKRLLLHHIGGCYCCRFCSFRYAQGLTVLSSFSRYSEIARDCHNVVLYAVQKLREHKLHIFEAI